MAEELQNKEVQSSYRSIFKATSLFGGVQIYQIIIQIIRSKFIAVILGPTGVGIQGLFCSATDLIKYLTSFGLAQSAVRDVSVANGSGDIIHIHRTVTIVRRLVWLTGLFGLVIFLLLSPLLSKWSFGNYDYAISFAFLSISILIDQLSAGQKVILQGLRRLKDLAKASALGSIIGLLITIPLYYYFKIDGIVPTLILHSVAILIISWLYSRKVKVPKITIKPKEVFVDGRQMMSLGISMSFSTILAAASSYVLRAFIRLEGGTVDVGLYTAGFAIMSSYVGMIFSAMGTDYYPRLSAVQEDNIKCRALVNQQGEIASLIITPLLSICIIFMPIAVQVLYSNEFMGACGYLLWASLGTMFKLGSWLISFQFVAKGESVLFVKNELLSGIYSFILNIFGYKYGGVTGVGVAYFISYFVYFMQVYFIAKHRYSFSFTKQFYYLYLFQTLGIGLTLGVALSCTGWVKYIIGSVIVISSALISISLLNKRMAIISFLRKK